MTKLKLTSKENAKTESLGFLNAAEKKFGFIPNLLGVLADSPSALQAYLTLGELLGKSSFTPEEQQVILLGTSVENNCDYCVAAHSMIALKMAGMPLERVTALRNGKNLEDKKLNELLKFTREVVNKRGFVQKESAENFLKAGYTNQHILEVILGVTMKTLSNYTNHLASTPLDPAFIEFKWVKA